jgi:hypothetical protein
MNKIFKKINMLIVGTFIFLTTSAFCADNKNSVEKHTCHSCCDPTRYRDICSDEDKMEVLLKGELLVWRGALSGLEPAFGKTEITTVDQNQKLITTLEESDKKPNFSWKAGFRVGAEFLFERCFNLETDWTHFHGYAGHENQEDKHGHWRLHYDTIDLTLAHNFYPCRNFFLKPFIGLRGAFIDQKLESNIVTTKTDNTQIEAPATPETINTTIDDKEKFWGVGPELGIEADWYLGWDLSVYAMFDAIPYYGNVHTKNHDTDTLIKAQYINNVKKENCFNSIGTDGAIGIRWDKYLCYSDCDLHLMLKLGAEQHRIYEFSNLGADGSLSLDGAVFEAGIGLRF